jgi:hypothetical protein
MPKLTELVVGETRWLATIEYEDGSVMERMTEFPAYASKDAVITAMKQQTPRLLICGSAIGIPQPKR